MDVPRSASNRIKITLQMLEGLPVCNDILWTTFRREPGYKFVPSLVDVSEEEVAEIMTSPEWFRFGFVRNPYHRLVSAYKMLILDESDTHYQHIRNEIRHRSNTSGSIPFSVFVDYVAAIPASGRDIHWQSQIELLMLDLIAYDFIGRQETFAEDFSFVLRRLGAPLPILSTTSERLKPSRDPDHAAVYNEDLSARVYSLYEGDFRAFSYAPDSWRSN